LIYKLDDPNLQQEISEIYNEGEGEPLKTAPSSAAPKDSNLDDLIQHAKSSSIYPIGPNGLIFGFLSQSVVENAAQGKVPSIRQIEETLPIDMASNFEFLPYTTPFIKFLCSLLQENPEATLKVVSKLDNARQTIFDSRYELT
jgi:hypothetical protein